MLKSLTVALVLALVVNPFTVRVALFPSEVGAVAGGVGATGVTTMLTLGVVAPGLSVPRLHVTV